LDSKRFDLLIEKHYEDLLSFFLKRGVNFDKAKDLRQEAITKAINGKDGFKGDKTEVFAGWLAQIARHIWINDHRKKGYRKIEQPMSTAMYEDGPCLEDFPDDHQDNDPLLQLIGYESQKMLETAVASLPPRMKQCLALYIQDRPYKDIATIMQVNINTVKSNIAQAKSILKERLVRKQGA